jgi:hypothetical protein
MYFGSVPRCPAIPYFSSVIGGGNWSIARELAVSS